MVRVCFKYGVKVNTINLVHIFYELGEEVKIGLVIGETSMYDYTGTKDIVRNLITEFGEKWTDIPKKIVTIFISSF